MKTIQNYCLMLVAALTIPVAGADGRADAADEPPKETAFQTPGAAFGIGRGVGVSQAKLVFGAHGGRVRVLVDLGLEIADADRAVGIEAEDFVDAVAVALLLNGSADGCLTADPANDRLKIE